MKKNIQVAIDSPAAAGAGTQAKLIAKKYNLFYLDTGKIYRFLGHQKIKNQKKFNYSLVKKKIRNIKLYHACKPYNKICLEIFTIGLTIMASVIKTK